MTSLVGLVFAVAAQAFDSGSTGADGALDFSGTPSGTTVDFIPNAFSPPLDPEGDSIYHFTTINIPAGVTVRFRADIAGSAPIHWLATGAVSIDGTLDLSGENGHGFSSVDARVPAVPGPGGFAGGIGSRQPNTQAQTGFGPGGGCKRVGNFAGGAASHATVPACYQRRDYVAIPPV